MRKRFLFTATVLVAILVSGCFAGCSKSSVKASDYIEAIEYKGLKVERMDTSVSDEEVEGEIDMFLSSLATVEKVSNRDEVKKGDIANIDYVGKRDGIAFEGGSANGFDLEIGGGRFIDGFEDGLVGSKVGSTVLLNLTFPENYPNNPDLAGAPVTFDVKVNYISEKIIPELTDSLVNEKTGGLYTSVPEYKAGIKQDLESEKATYADTKMYSDLMETVLNSVVLKNAIPDELIQKKINIMKDNIKTYADSYGVDYNTFLKNYMGMEPEEFTAQCNLEAETAAKKSLVINYIAEKEKLDLTKDEINKAVDEYTAMYGYESSKDFKEKTDMEQFEEYILESKVQEFIADNAEITVGDEKAW